MSDIEELKQYETDQHKYCDEPGDLVAHLAEIEAGWTLQKPWKVSDEARAKAENEQDIREMLARWEAHGVKVSG